VTRAWSARLASVVLAAGGLCMGLAVGGVLSGCYRCECGEYPPVELGSFEILNAHPDRPELVGGTVEAGAEQVEISFTDDEGIDWLIVYRVVE
jgi:hypothetical protein